MRFYLLRMRDRRHVALVTHSRTTDGRPLLVHLHRWPAGSEPTEQQMDAVQRLTATAAVARLTGGATA